MQNWPFIMHFWKVSNTCRTVGVLLFDAFSNLCLANAVEPLRAANTLARKQLYRWQFLSLDGAVVTSSSGLPVQPEMPLTRHAGGDYLFVMPSYGYARHVSSGTGRALRAAQTRFDAIAGMDTGAWLLASAGLLDGRRATIHWDEQALFAERYPEVDVVADRVVRDGDMLTCQGASTTFELVLGLIERHHGPMLRHEVASMLVPQAPPLPSMADPEPPNRQAEALVALMRHNIETPLPIGEIAQTLGLSQRALQGLALQHFGLTPRRLYLAIRLREIRRLIENTALSVEEIAHRGGYRNASAMTRVFRSEFGLAPTALRQAAG